MIKNFIKENNIEFYEDKSLKNFNTYRINTICKYLVFPKNIDELIKLLQNIKKYNIKYYVLGNGSNVIFSKDYYDGIIIKLDKFNKIIYNQNEVSVGAGVSLIKFALDTIDKSLSGLEFATGIPGCVGASTAMNAGAYNEDMSMVVKKVIVLTSDGDILEVEKNDMNFSYRNSLFKNNKKYIILETLFELKKGNKEEMLLKVNERKEKRINTQPLNFPNAGSVFRNPENAYAGELIEKCNLKGFSINGAKISEKHANFIINENGARGEDIINLVNVIKKEVKKKYNIDLKLEQLIVE